MSSLAVARVEAGEAAERANEPRTVQSSRRKRQVPSERTVAAIEFLARIA